MIVGRTMWTQSTSVTDRQTDGQTDRQTELLSQRPCNAERRTVKMPEFCVICARKNNKIPKFYTTFAGKMPEFRVLLTLGPCLREKYIPGFYLGVGSVQPC